MLRSRSNLVLATATAAVALPLAAFAGGTAPAATAKARPQPSSSVEVGTANIAKLGTVLVRGSGRALYMFQPDAAAKLSCSASCQKIWPPLYAPTSGVAKAIGGARQSLIGSIKNPVNGKRVVTYDGWPLYTYVLDKKKREATGQNVALNGGFWWVLTPAGKINRTPISHGGGYVGS